MAFSPAFSDFTISPQLRMNLVSQVNQIILHATINPVPFRRHIDELFCDTLQLLRWTRAILRFSL
ncbi:hypothetical protein KU836_001074 [Salmonella enterica]|nr:hypothetical protein [Salmonella enterica]